MTIYQHFSFNFILIQKVIHTLLNSILSFVSDIVLENCNQSDATCSPLTGLSSIVTYLARTICIWSLDDESIISSLLAAIPNLLLFSHLPNTIILIENPSNINTISIIEKYWDVIWNTSIDSMDIVIILIRYFSLLLEGRGADDEDDSHRTIFIAHQLWHCNDLMSRLISLCVMGIERVEDIIKPDYKQILEIVSDAANLVTLILQYHDINGENVEIVRLKISPLVAAAKSYYSYKIINGNQVFNDSHHLSRFEDNLRFLIHLFEQNHGNISNI